MFMTKKYTIKSVLVYISRVQIAGHAATTGGPNDERSEVFEQLHIY